MRASLRYAVDVEDKDELSRLRQSGHDHLAESATVVASSSAVEDLEFTVVGSVRGKPDESWSQVVRAADPDEAKAKAIEDDEKRTVVAAIPGAPLIE